MPGSKPKDITGHRFGRLVAVAPAANIGRCPAWLCRCDCGNEKTATGSNLRRGNVQSCGCLVTTHGQSRTSEYRVWALMWQRCTNVLNTNYGRYGAQGVLVCDAWRDFTRFFADMGPRPNGTSLDRVNSRGNYEPSNCRWATRREQNVNTTRWAGFRDVNDEKVSMREIADRLAVPESFIRMRLTR